VYVLSNCIHFLVHT
jgi:hypothetical protein